MRTRLGLGAMVVLVLGLAIYWFGIREASKEPTVYVPRLAAQIGAGSEAVGVTGSGAIVRWLPLPDEPPLPSLPLEAPPKSGRLKGPALEQAQVLGAAPPALVPYLESSYYGESGVDVNLANGIELRFGNSSQAARKWRAAAAVLADPSITALDYVDLQAPSRPATYGSEHELPTSP